LFDPTNPCRLAGPSLILILALFVPALPAGAEEAETWIVVPAPAFRDAVKPLEAQRRAQGFHVVRIDWEEPDTLGAQALRTRIHGAVRAAGGRASVLLVGATGVAGDDPRAVVPAFDGTVERMRGHPTDTPYGSLDGDQVEEIAVGRLPARTVAEATAMVGKTIRFENRPPPRPHRFDLALIVGHPGGGSAFEKRLASVFINGQITPRIRRIHPRWTTRALFHMAASPYCVPNDHLDAMTKDLLCGDQPFTIYLGHSSPRGFGSDGLAFAMGEMWSSSWEEGAPRGGAPRGLLLSCGCYACQLSGFFGVGYGVRSLRAPGGHVAVVGAQLASYGAMGKLAFEGLMDLLEADAPPVRLGDWFLAMDRGLATGPIGRLTFKVYDDADGTGGKVPLATQREEALEMWMLLGDPALRLPFEPSSLHLEVDGKARAGATLRIRGTLPAALAGGDAAVTITVERAFGTLPKDGPALPAGAGEAKDKAMLERHAAANDPVLLRKVVESRAGVFETTLVLPDALPDKGLRVRATCATPDLHAMEAVALPSGN